MNMGPEVNGHGDSRPSVRELWNLTVTKVGELLVGEGWRLKFSEHIGYWLPEPGKSFRKILFQHGGT